MDSDDECISARVWRLEKALITVQEQLGSTQKEHIKLQSEYKRLDKAHNRFRDS